ncbi:MAG: hypothetical protein DRI77_14150 [Chloroflexi bacterium]|nr:MAG: hypothetical protein DRI77_14150 [Chloroflexota bacterium]
MPIAINITASPTLKAAINDSPSKMRLTVTAISKIAMASGQGTNPPLMPIANSERHVTWSPGRGRNFARGAAPARGWAGQ